jgi:hypothetical protein
VVIGLVCFTNEGMPLSSAFQLIHNFLKFLMAKKKAYYFVDLDVPDKSLRVDEYDLAFLKRDLKEWGRKNVMDLNDYDWRIFDSEAKAETFLKKYKAIKKGLSNRKICKSRELPAILYKRRYMVLTLMGLKPQTYRDYSKPWKKGQLFNLHDQVLFLTVKLKSLTYDKKEKLYCYKFSLP